MGKIMDQNKALLALCWQEMKTKKNEMNMKKKSFKSVDLSSRIECKQFRQWKNFYFDYYDDCVSFERGIALIKQ